MEEAAPEAGPFDDFPAALYTPDQEKINKLLLRYELKYARGRVITGSLGTPTKTLDEFIRERDIPALEHEFNRASTELLDVLFPVGPDA